MRCAIFYLSKQGSMFAGKHFGAACQRAYPPIPHRNVKHQHAASHKDCNVFPFIHKNVLLINHPPAVARTRAALPYAGARRGRVSSEMSRTNQRTECSALSAEATARRCLQPKDRKDPPGLVPCLSPDLCRPPLVRGRSTRRSPRPDPACGAWAQLRTDRSVAVADSRRIG